MHFGITVTLSSTYNLSKIFYELFLSVGISSFYNFAWASCFVLELLIERMQLLMFILHADIVANWIGNNVTWSGYILP